MQDVLSFAAQKVREGQKVALVTVTGVEKSSPASPGQMMAVLSDGSIAGTVGGGASEYLIIRKAVEAIENGDVIFKFSLDHAECGMTCGGNMEGFGSILGNRDRLYIFGGGHIAQCLARIAVQTGFFVVVVEDRPEFSADFESVRYLLCKPEEYGANVPVSASDFAVICTRGHATDGEALRYCLTRRPKYLGMIGSERKVSLLLAKLRDEGKTQEEIDSIYSPIGLDIADAVPAEIAVSILAEILLVKNNGTPRHRKRSGG